MPKCSTLIMLLVIIKDNPLMGSPQYPSVEEKINSKLASEFLVVTGKVLFTQAYFFPKQVSLWVLVKDCYLEI